MLKVAALDEKTREEVDQLTRLLTSNLEKLARHSKQADAIVENILLHAQEGTGDPWAADIDALCQEFSGQSSSGEDASSQNLLGQDLSAQDSLSEDSLSQNSRGENSSTKDQR